MAYITGEVVSSSDKLQPFKVVFRHSDGGEIISEWLCASKVEGESQIIEALQGLKTA
jgi:hypothetical protein